MARKNRRMKIEYHRGLDFDPKKYISAPSRKVIGNAPQRLPMRGDIWFADLGGHPDSSVQGGIRPVIVLSNNIGNAHADTVNVVPMTRHLKRPELPCHTELHPDSITDKRQFLDVSMVLAEQLTTISKYALRSYAGHISDAVTLEKIGKAIAAQLGMERSPAKCQ